MRRWGWADFYCGWHYDTAWALKITALIQDNLHLLFDRFGSQQMVECLTAGYTVAIIVRAAVRTCNEMFNRGFCFRERLSAEEALASLGEQQTVKVGGHLQ